MCRTQTNSLSTIYGEETYTSCKMQPDVGELGTEFATEETPLADTAVTTQLYRNFDPLKLHTAVHHAQNKPTLQ